MSDSVHMLMGAWEYGYDWAAKVEGDKITI